MYSPPGFGLSEVGDVEVFPRGDELHLFHLTLPNHDLVQHAVSSDGLAWRPLPNALRTGDPGACDDDMIWTMSVSERNSRFYMVYTALARAENGLVQRTALATSTDLIHWEKHPDNPVAAADPRWYETEPLDGRMVSWRDPKPLRVGDTYYATVCARENAGPPLRRGCVGLLASPDLVHWEAWPPLFAPRAYWDLECPQAFRIGERYYLTASVMEDRTQRYWVADGFPGPYGVPPDGGILAPAGHYAGRVCRWQDQDLYFCWHQARYDWPGFRNPHGKFVVAPLVLAPRPDGSLARRSFPGWEGYRAHPPDRLDPGARTLFGDRAVSEIDGWRLDTPAGRDVLASAEEVGDTLLEGVLTVDAPLGGLAFRLDERGGGYFITLAPGRDEVSLAKWLPATEADGPGFRFAELQRGRLPRPLRLGAPLPFRLILSGPYLECSLDGEVILATLSAARTVGKLGIWAETGAIRAEGMARSALREVRG